MRPLLTLLFATLMAAGGVCALDPLGDAALAHADAGHHPVGGSSSDGDAPHWAPCDPILATSGSTGTVAGPGIVPERIDISDLLSLAKAPSSPPGRRLAPERPPAFLLHASLLI